MADQEYENKILKWRAEKEDSLRRENGWLALAGLFWLNEGENRAGSDANCDIVLPPRAPAYFGTFTLTGKTVRLRLAEGVGALVNGEAVTEADLRSTREAQPSYITFDDMRMVIHAPAHGLALRLWDNQRPERRLHPPREWFPVNERFRLPARYVRYRKPKKTMQPDYFGEAVEDRMDGYVTFEFEGRTYQLDATEEEDKALFIKFRDLTSGKETYPASRYDYTEPPVRGKLTLDFNYAYNPPCAFTEFATCVFAPEQNHLDFRVTAGEIYKLPRKE